MKNRIAWLYVLQMRWGSVKICDVCDSNLPLCAAEMKYDLINNSMLKESRTNICSWSFLDKYVIQLFCGRPYLNQISYSAHESRSISRAKRCPMTIINQFIDTPATILTIAINFVIKKI